MSTWLWLRYHPSVFVRRNYRTGSILVEQDSPPLRSNNCTKTLKTHYWKIPITFTTQEKLEFADVSKSKIMMGAKTMYINEQKTSGWVLFNIKQAGEYRLHIRRHVIVSSITHKNNLVGLIKCFV